VKEKMMIYPFDAGFSAILRHQSLLEGYEISKLVSPRGWGLCDNDASVADSGSYMNIWVWDNFDEALKECDTIFFTKPDNTIFDFENIVKNPLLKSAEAGKNIICTIAMKEELKERLLNICNKKGTYFRYYGEHENYNKHFPKFEYEKISRIRTPVIVVLGTSEKTNKFEIQLSLRENLLEMGYKVSQVGTRKGCELMGFHSFPEFMFSPSLNESGKVFLYNQFIKNLEVKDDPDVIIIGIPGGIVPFNEELTNRFGVLAFEISNAIAPDVVIFSTLYTDYSPSYFELLSTTIKYKLGYNIDFFNIANHQFDWESARQEKMLVFTTIDSSFVSKKISSYPKLCKPIYNILDKKNAQNMANSIVNLLSGEYNQLV
jgi:peptide maturation system protein (TIGR04066 family)